jgi:hypothetical protein
MLKISTATAPAGNTNLLICPAWRATDSAIIDAAA